jgi:hypothetical protein
VLPISGTNQIAFINYVLSVMTPEDLPGVRDLIVDSQKRDNGQMLNTNYRMVNEMYQILLFNYTKAI